MLFVTGDCHGDFRRFSTRAFPLQKQLTGQDIVVILGDAGFLWDGGRSDQWWLDWLDSRPFTVVDIGGNHENYDLLEQYPLVHRFGGAAYQLRDSVFHLCRGQVVQLGGFSAFVMGGAQSHDMEAILPRDGQLKERERRFARRGIPYRVLGKSWWFRELPSQQELYTGWNTLRREGHGIELVLSHCAPTSVQQLLAPRYPQNDLTDFLQLVKESAPYEQWFCGHYHLSRHLPEHRFRAVYEEIIPVE